MNKALALGAAQKTETHTHTLCPTKAQVLEVLKGWPAVESPVSSVLVFTSFTILHTSISNKLIGWGPKKVRVG
jgi:hypothetical protein